MPPKVSESHKEERRSELLLSALQCFAKKGYEATTVDDIVKNAGVSKGMLYNYFPSKEDIFLQLLQERTDEFFQSLRALFDGLGTASEQLRALVHRYREMPMSEERREWITVSLEFFLSSSRHDHQRKLMQIRYNDFVSFLEEVLEHGKRSGEFRADANSRVVASMFWALCDGIGLHYTQIQDASLYNQLWQSTEEALFGYLQHG